MGALPLVLQLRVRQQRGGMRGARRPPGRRLSCSTWVWGGPLSQRSGNITQAWTSTALLLNGLLSFFTYNVIFNIPYFLQPILCLSVYLICLSIYLLLFLSLRFPEVCETGSFSHNEQICKVLGLGVMLTGLWFSETRGALSLDPCPDYLPALQVGQDSQPSRSAASSSHLKD